MAVKYTVLEDGSILFDSYHAFVTNSYYQDPGNPLHYIPKFRVCTRRSLEILKKECGERYCRWVCDKLNQTVSVDFCKKCEIYEPK